MAQRAGKKQRVKAIQAKIANTRADWTHKTTTAIARRAKLIVIGDVSSAKLIKTPFAKSTLDAAWYSVRHQLHTKPTGLLGSVSQAVNRSPVSLARTVANAPARVDYRALGVRTWVCSRCGSAHERDVNAARNILDSPCGTSHAIQGNPPALGGGGRQIADLSHQHRWQPMGWRHRLGRRLAALQAEPRRRSTQA